VVAVSLKRIHFETARMDPKKMQKPHLPLIVGGYARPALRRAVEFGAGWYGFSRDPAGVKAMLAKLDAAFAKAGRTRPADFRIIITPPGDMPVDAMQAYAEIGVHEIVPNLGSQRAERVGPRLKEIAALKRAMG